MNYNASKKDRSSQWLSKPKRLSEILNVNLANTETHLLSAHLYCSTLFINCCHSLQLILMTVVVTFY